MKQTRQVVIPQRTRDEEIGVTCDICGAKGSPGRDPFHTGGYSDVNECTIEREHGFSCDGDYDLTTESYDVCPACWANVLVPLFKNPPSVRTI